MEKDPGTRSEIQDTTPAFSEQSPVGFEESWNREYQQVAKDLGGSWTADEVKRFSEMADREE